MDHKALLLRAARVSSAILVCHRDIWEFITGQAGQHPHFRMPPRITDRGQDRIAAAVSGRSLIAVLISLFNAQHADGRSEGDWALATTIYGRIKAGLDVLAPAGEPVTIILDDRTPETDPGAPTCEADSPPKEEQARTPEPEKTAVPDHETGNDTEETGDTPGQEP
ncbi:hypothetical protein [Streptomyces sp. URMC 129]|uniref:hypothetical protein n=1 Tax=Streptomyces sp. URMC 129 TaxID=3423407 RepID=UPI003F1B9F1E